MVEIKYKLVGTGWAECTLRVGESHVVLAASYLSDALGSLCDATLELINGVESSRFSFDEEPGEYRGVFTMLPEGRVAMRILEFHELWGDLPDDQGKCVLDETVSLGELARAVYEAAAAVLKEHGLEGYRSKWVEHEFPEAAFRKLEAHAAAI